MRGVCFGPADARVFSERAVLEAFSDVSNFLKVRSETRGIAVFRQKRLEKRLEKRLVRNAWSNATTHSEDSSIKLGSRVSF